MNQKNKEIRATLKEKTYKKAMNDIDCLGISQTEFFILCWFNLRSDLHLLPTETINPHKISDMLWVVLKGIQFEKTIGINNLEFSGEELNILSNLAEKMRYNIQKNGIIKNENVN